MADFHDAATRHLEDAKALAIQNRPDNSCYHAGYAVECTVKLVQYLNKARWYGHLYDLIPLIQGKAATQINIPSLKSMSICSPGAGWFPDMRYDPSGIPAHQANNWVTESERFFTITRAKLIADGVL